MNATHTLKVLAERAVSRIALALLLAMAIMLVPAFTQSTIKHGPLAGIETVVALTSMILHGFLN